eukprot:scaffold36697_cov21-Phaeocystis_antarctica.AAC.1
MALVVCMCAALISDPMAPGGGLELKLGPVLGSGPGPGLGLGSGLGCGFDDPMAPLSTMVCAMLALTERLRSAPATPACTCELEAGEVGEVRE